MRDLATQEEEESEEEEPKATSPSVAPASSSTPSTKGKTSPEKDKEKKKDGEKHRREKSSKEKSGPKSEKEKSSSHDRSKSHSRSKSSDKSEKTEKAKIKVSSADKVKEDKPKEEKKEEKVKEEKVKEEKTKEEKTKPSEEKKATNGEKKTNRKSRSKMDVTSKNAGGGEPGMLRKAPSAVVARLGSTSLSLFFSLRKSPFRSSQILSKMFLFCNTFHLLISSSVFGSLRFCPCLSFLCTIFFILKPPRPWHVDATGLSRSDGLRSCQRCCQDERACG